MSISKRLALIRKSLKTEPIEIDNGTTSDNQRRIQNVQQNPSINNEALRNQFLNKILTAQDVIGSSSMIDKRNVKHASTQLAGVYNRAEDINARLKGNSNNSPFYAHVPENSNEPAIPGDRHESPLVQNNNNAMFKFQASSENVEDVMIKSNPNRDIPYKAHRTANIIGANLQLIKKSIKEEKQKRKIPPPPAFSEPKVRRVEYNVQASTSKDDNSNDRSSRVDMVDKCVQTTVNTGTLQFEITANELQNLSEEKKIILLEFMKTFGIRDSQDIKSIRERLKHRLANQENKRKQHLSAYGSYPPTFGPPI
ncbi:unnamed protein product [Chironomus riparius]|uniref:Uncharacterized protein n=1 Tax=Chironomus riparius TaxID=315576 RepID=A0A9N9WT11_9DIPT|nr:unnamed protein product [Chironomus riparius]